MMNDALYHYNCCVDAYLSYFGEFYKKKKRIHVLKCFYLYFKSDIKTNAIHVDKLFNTEASMLIICFAKLYAYDNW